MASLFGQMKGWQEPLPKSDNLVQNQPTGEDEHISHARHILSFYKFHVQGIDDLINHYDQERDARRKAEKKQKDALEKTKVELNEIKEQLATTRSELDASTAALSKAKEASNTTEKKLDATKKELATTKTQLQTTQADLSKTKEASNTTEKKLDATKKELATTKTQLQTTQADLSKTKDQLHTSEGKLQRTTAELTTTNERLKDTSGDVKNLTKERDNLKLAVQGFKEIIAKKEEDLAAANLSEKAKEDEKDAAFVARDKAKAMYVNLLASGCSAFQEHKDRTLGDYYIEHAVYGNSVIVDHGVIKKLLKHAVDHERFKVADRFFGLGSQKNDKADLFTVIYAIKGQGPFKIISVKEGEWMKFD